ncbi:MAG: hypothetical protein KDE47_18595 [Caldilineaceae bacterium]|nr:hypothetical protein [Caldilineaceae bacterium]
MYELHEYEQYFFDPPTLDQLSTFLARWQRPCCICAPLVGKRLAEQGVNVRILDIDERFAKVKGFRRYDLYRPEWLEETYDVLFCDPPFFNVTLAQLFGALRLLSHNDFAQPLLVGYLKRREAAILGTFAKFGLQSTGYQLGYQTVKPIEKNVVELYSNLDLHICKN